MREIGLPRRGSIAVSADPVAYPGVASGRNGGNGKWVSLWILAGGRVKLGKLIPTTPEAGMPTLTIEYTTDAERLALEQAIAFFTHMRHVADNAPDGAVLAACEQVALDDGRRLLKDTLAAALQARADATDVKKKCPAAAAKDDTPAGS
jgi:hypothetical protein